MHMRSEFDRRRFLQATGLAALGGTLAACASDDGIGGAAPEPTQPAPTGTFTEPSAPLSGALSILMWSHFVPAHDTWFDPWVQEWGSRVGLQVTVDHINYAELPARTQAEIQANQGHDLILHIAPVPQYEPSVLDLTDVVTEANNRHGEMLELCRKSSFNPTTGKYFGYAPAWVPDPGDYRKTLWTPVGLPEGPTTWDELLRGGTEIKNSQGVQLGIGMSQEIDSNMAGRALLWSFGASIQDESEQVVINSPEAVAAVEFMSRLYRDAMTPEVFSWNAASNNQGLAAGQLSYILNSLSAWRTSQETDPEVAADIFFSPALRGPADARAASHVMYNWIVPNFAANPDAAKEFLLHYTANLDVVAWNSKLYDFPAYTDVVPDLGKWLGADPFGAQPPDKLSLLEDAVEWSTNIGYPGTANTAEGEVFATFVIPNMFARAARGEVSPQQAVADAEAQIIPIFDNWRARGLIGTGGS
ncbi:ABC transporter substrate-binding protein [Pseudonocardia kunmingensis]|uniref:Carbohydrate ABC transporter substrate-binding protein (CUT1 family) n=1 Tax=Pseudonocardia kunmingensis TaxID=630975 RepID=A0A543DZA2_9PSEU|nr:extracellular solute-binding protein [Pseudonocardia kunmingensis]TQM14614.1 carbohydrate ABC transporter substrate-binding protein (CUT1 family) [Pseudonocardia kunmingensis]